MFIYNLLWLSPQSHAKTMLACLANVNLPSASNAHLLAYVELLIVELKHTE